jgi:hypothetical protein
MAKRKSVERGLAEMTHAELVARAEAWLRNHMRCRVVLCERSSAAGETPDAIGWRGSSYSILVECKVSRSDFRADLQKPWRRYWAGMGCERYYMAPPGLLKPHEVPGGWGLLEVWPKTVRVARKAQNRVVPGWCLRYELRLLLSELFIWQALKAGRPLMETGRVKELRELFEAAQ